jgi:hypothetical protein
MQELAEALLDFVIATSRRAFRLARQHWIAILSVAVFALICQAVIRGYSLAAERDLWIYTGLPGSDSHAMGAKLQKSLAQHYSVYGRPYRVRLEEMTGNDAIQERVRNDSAGTAIGFAQDERGNAPEAMAIAPIERDYLHVIAGPTLLAKLSQVDLSNSGIPNADSVAKVSNSVNDDARKQSVSYWKEKPVKMRELIGHFDLAGGRVYLGPHRSETRRLAIKVMEQCGQRNLDRLSAHGIGDWYEVRAALNTGTIELAFLVGTLGHDVVKGIADDGNCRLVDLSEISDALEQENPEFKSIRIPQNAYAAAGYRPYRYEFCPQEIKTLTSRNIIICSRNMTRFDAFQIAAAADEALRADFPNGLWKQMGESDPPLTTELHPGSELHKSGATSPTYWSISNWPTWLLTITSTMGLLFLTGFLRRVTAKVPELASERKEAVPTSNGQAQPTAELSTPPAELERSVERWENDSLALFARIHAAAAPPGTAEPDTLDAIHSAVARVVEDAPRRNKLRARKNGTHPKVSHPR